MHFKTVLFYELVLFFLIIQHAVAIAFVSRVGNLLSELFAHALGVLRALAATGTVPARLLQPLLYDVHDLFVFIKPDFHLPYRLLG